MRTLGGEHVAGFDYFAAYFIISGRAFNAE